MKQKKVFVKAGILLLSLLLLPGLTGCGAISNLMATPTPTITPTPTLIPTPTPTPTSTPIPIVLACKIVYITGAAKETYPYNIYAPNYIYIGTGKPPETKMDALQVDIVDEQGSALRDVKAWENQNIKSGAGKSEMTLVVQEKRTYSLSGNSYTIDARIGYVFKDFRIVEYKVVVTSNTSSQECSK